MGSGKDATKRMKECLLRVEDVCVCYPGKEPKRAVDGVTFDVARGACLGIVGGSGCGKTTLAKAIMGLEPLESGRILFEQTVLVEAKKRLVKANRRAIQMVFQDTLGALNPRMRMRTALSEVLRFHCAEEVQTPDAMKARLHELMEQVELSPDLLEKYPHEMSGGQRQRMGIARALAVRPQLLIADEPVSALDVAVQAQLLKMLRRLLDRTGLTLLLIAHDLAVVQCLCDEALVMDAGRLVERGDPRTVFHAPQSAAAQALVAAVPDVDAWSRPTID